MTTRRQSIQSLIDQLNYLQENEKIASLAFALIQPDGTPIFGHGNPTYDLLGALEQAKLAMGASMLRDAEDAPGFEPNKQDH